MSLAPVNKKILIVDDQDSTRKLLRLALKETTLTIIEAAGAVEGKRPPSTVIAPA